MNKLLFVIFHQDPVCIFHLYETLFLFVQLYSLFQFFISPSVLFSMFSFPLPPFFMSLSFILPCFFPFSSPPFLLSFFEISFSFSLTVSIFYPFLYFTCYFYFPLLFSYVLPISTICFLFSFSISHAISIFPSSFPMFCLSPPLPFRLFKNFFLIICFFSLNFSYVLFSIPVFPRFAHISLLFSV